MFRREHRETALHHSRGPSKNTHLYAGLLKMLTFKGGGLQDGKIVGTKLFAPHLQYD